MGKVGDDKDAKMQSREESGWSLEVANKREVVGPTYFRVGQVSRASVVGFSAS